MRKDQTDSGLTQWYAIINPQSHLTLPVYGA
jgi:hypothetical protein